ncbi:acetyl-CoA carboxylase biotin carboxylase subunit family protein [Chloroflexota bacterium]
MTDTFLIIYPVQWTFCDTTRTFLAKLRKERGLQIVLADDSPVTSENDIFDDFIKIPSSEHVQDTYETLSNWCDKHSVKGIYMQSEAALPVGSLLARELELPGPSVEAVHLCINKYLSRKRLSQYGVPTPQFTIGENASDVYKYVSEFGYPLVLKAVASAHSKLVTPVYSKEGVEPAVQYLKASLIKSREIIRLSNFARLAGLEPGCSLKRQFLIESFVEGDSLETDGIIVEGEPITFGITEQIPSKDTPFFIEGYLCPADHPVTKLQEIRRLSDLSLAATGLHSSGFSIEMRVKADQTYIIEVNGRLGSDDGFGELYETYTGNLPALQALKLSLGLPLESASDEDVCVAVAYRSYYDDGIIDKLPEELISPNLDYGDITCGTMCKEGTRLYKPPHPDAYPHLAWVKTTHPETSRDAYLSARMVADKLDISVKPIEH